MTSHQGAGRVKSKGFAVAAAGIATAAVSLLLAPAASAAPVCSPSGANIVCTYSSVGPDTFTVPAGVTQVTLDAFGAQGGTDIPGVSEGGLGGSGSATIAVTPGQVLQVNVGGKGGDARTALPNGGFNGGGSGGDGDIGPPQANGPGGGGASDVRTGSYALADRVVVGGGGGGAGNDPGGTGGGTTGGTGGASALNGEGGTQTAGGDGGFVSGALPGTPGVAGTGGEGGGSSSHSPGGGGGGGGYFGGGGGAATSGGAKGSGGGGSGLGTTLNSGVRAGNGLVTVTYAGGQLRVVKSLSPALDPGKFNLQINGNTQAANVGNDGNTGLQTVTPGTNTVGETAGTSTSLSDYTSAIVCKANDGAGATVASGSGAGPLNVPVGVGDQIACTITNTRETGQLRVVKDLVPNVAPGKFNLQIDGTTEAANVGDGGDTGLKTVNTGTRTVGETAGTATSMGDYTSAIVCKASDGAGATVASGSGAGPLNVPVGSGDQIACTITNTLVNLVPVKLSTSASPGVDLGGSVHDTATLADGSSPTGQITFRLYGPGDAACSGAPVFTDTVAASGNGSYDSQAFTPTQAGTYRWVASYSGDNVNKAAAGSCNEPGESVTVTEPVIPVTPAIEVTGLERDRDAGTATLTVAASVPGRLWLEKTNKVKGFGPVDLPAAGDGELEVAPRNKVAKKLSREGHVTVNPRIRFAPADGSPEIGIRHEFALRQD